MYARSSSGSPEPRLRRGLRLASAAVAFSLLVAGCDPGATGPASDGARFHFRAPSAAKADGADAGFLPASEVSELTADLEAAIAKVDESIVALELDIARVEADQRVNLARIDSLIRDIELRKAEIKRNQKAKKVVSLVSGFFGIAFPPALLITAASAIMAINDDPRIRSLSADLASARAQRDSLDRQHADYLARRDALRAKLTTLRAAEAELVTLLSSGVPIVETRADAPEGASPALDLAVWRVTTLRQLLANGQSQVALLTELRALALALDAAILRALESIQAFAAAADAALAASDAEVDQLIAIALSPDPIAAAEAWLENLLAAKTKALLAYYGWPVPDFVDFIVSHRASSVDAIADDLAQRLVDAIVNAIMPEPTPSETSEPSEPSEPSDPTPTTLEAVLYDAADPDDADTYVALGGAPGASLAGWTLVDISGVDGSATLTIALAGALDDNGRFLIVNQRTTSDALRMAAGQLAACDLGHGPDSILLIDAQGMVRDALAYGAYGPDAIAAGEGAPCAGVEPDSGHALVRVQAGVDSNDNLVDWMEVASPY